LTFDGLLSEQDSTFTRHIHRISIKRKLAEFYYLCGQTSKAERLLESVVETIGDSSSKARNERALLLNLQGILQWDCGLLHDAINLCDQSIATYGDDPDATNTVLNRAVVLRDLGELQEAEQIFNHHLLAQETTEHASLGYTNLASIYRLQGKCAEAMELYERTIAAMDGSPDLTAALLLTLHSQAT
jgi:tetratricopeptide (TPR) repeat protein